MLGVSLRGSHVTSRPGGDTNYYRDYTVVSELARTMMRFHFALSDAFRIDIHKDSTV